MPRLRQILVFLVTLVCAFATLGQGTTGTIVGSVTSDGAALPGVTVTISSPAMQGTRTAITGEGGGYTFPSLPPGKYTVAFEVEGMAKVTKNVSVQLASTARADAEMKMSSVSEAITVTATAPAVMENTDVARNYSAETISELPVRRNIVDTVLLAPGVNNSGARGNISISGAASYDNLFLVNGVTVNENLRGQPHDLFIEDAIQETTVLTGAVSAEYGRFTGGVVSSLTKSGGNEFHGSLRDTFNNAAWIAKTPVETTDHLDEIAQVYEGTLGGYAWRDRLWFFAAGRDAKGAPAVGINPIGSTSAPTGQPVTTFSNTVDERRYEVKLTAQLFPQHSLVGSYLDVDKTETNNFFAPIYDVDSIVQSRSLPNSLLAVSYNGVLTSNLLVEGQYSEKEFQFIGSGGVFTDQIKGTWIQDNNGTGTRWNAPVFCGVCTPEARNNDSLVAKATYFVNTKSLGTHNFVAGGEDYHETRIVNNYQSGSQFEIFQGPVAIYANGKPYPTFDTNTRLRHRPILTPSQGSDLSTRAFFVNDKWDFNSHWNFNVGVRYDKNDAIDASGNVVSDDSAFSPRLGAMYDIAGDGRYRINASYSHYVTKIVDGNVGGGAAGAGVPALFSYRYGGPVINAAGTATDQLIPTQEALATLFAWFNGLTEDQKKAALVSSSIPGYTTQIKDPISSPYVREIVLGFGTQIGTSGNARIDLIDRKWDNAYATRIDGTTGRFTAPNGATGDLALIINDDGFIERTYQAVQTQFAWARGRFNLGGGYTWSHVEGNDLPEGDGTAGVTNQFGHYYPEYLGYERRAPKGTLLGDQTHRLRAWLGYDIPFPVGQLNATVLQAYDSGRAYSAIGNINAGPTGTASCGTNAATTLCASPVVANPGYLLSSIADSHAYYFSERGAFRTDAATSTDLSLNYKLPIGRVELFAQGQVLNVFEEETFNDIYLNRMDFTVRTARSGGVPVPAGQPAVPNSLKPFNPYTETPVECPQGAAAQVCKDMGANFQLGPNFGKAINKDAYQSPRTLRFAVGIRF
ncbi:MAG: TonB-dependent receptor domain-containing protein [Thermoanaerobaculia bacterium]